MSFQYDMCVWYIMEILTWPRVDKAFQNKDQDQAQVKNSYSMDYF